MVLSYNSNSNSSGSTALEPKNINDIDDAGSRKAVLLIHGFGDTPQSLQYLAEFLSDRGLNVYVPLLPGHGSTVAEFDRSTSSEWIEAAERELLRLQSEYAWVSVCGLSMGGAIAAILAARHPTIKSLSLIAPYLGAKPKVWLAGKFYRILNLVIKSPVSESSPESIHDPEEREKNLSYGSVTPNSIHNLTEIVKLAQRALPNITVPTLLIQSRNDNRVSESVARRSFKKIGSVKKKLIITEVGGHVITVDYGKERIFNAIYNFIIG